MWLPARPDVRVLDLDTRHELGFFDDALDRVDRLLEVDHHPLAEPLRLRRADADDVDAAFLGHFGDDRRDFGRTDIEANDVFVFLAQNDAPPEDAAWVTSRPTFEPVLSAAIDDLRTARSTTSSSA